MNTRDRFIKTLLFDSPDRPYFHHAFGLMPGVIERWHKEGLPENIGEQDIRSYFGFDLKGRGVAVNLLFYPLFEPEIVEETDEYIIRRETDGQLTQMYPAVSSLPHAIGYPVETPKDWEAVKERLQYSAFRFAPDWVEQAEQTRKVEGLPLSFGGKGFYWMPRDILGDERLCLWYYEEPETVHDILTTYTELLCALAEEVTAKVQVDSVHFGEDMAYRGGSMIGPNIFREFILPCYLRIFDIFRSGGTRLFSVDTDGLVDGLIPLFLEAGVNVIGPMEVRAGNDLISLRRQYGRRIAFTGGLDKLILPEGRQAIDREVEGKIPLMLEQGGYLPSLDHRVVVETPLSAFGYYVKRVFQLMGQGETAACVPHSEPDAFKVQ